MQERKFDPQSNQLNVSQMRTANFFTYLAKQYFEKYPTVELHSIGNAMNVAIRTADILVKYPFPHYFIGTAMQSTRRFQRRCQRALLRRRPS